MLLSIVEISGFLGKNNRSKRVLLFFMSQFDRACKDNGNEGGMINGLQLLLPETSQQYFS